MCPACHQPTLRDHCTSPTCAWLHCRNTGCDLVLDPGMGSGHRIKDKKHRERFETT